MAVRMTAILTVCAAMTAPPGLAQDAAQDAVEGALLYADFCAVCHGISGQGDGPMVEVLSVEVPDLTALSGEDGAFPLLRVIGQIDGRVRPLAHGGAMPLFGRAFEWMGADVALAGPGGQPVLVSQPIADLVAFLREIQD